MAKTKSRVPALFGSNLNNVEKIDRDDVESIKKFWVEKVEQGEVEASQLHVALTLFHEVFYGRGSGKYKKPGVKDLTKEHLLQELSNYSKGEKLAVGNFEITQKETGVRYDYSHDPVWNDLNEKLKTAKKALADREKRLKAAPKPDTLKGIKAETELDQDTGEVFEVLPPVKTSSISPEIKYRKS